MCLSGKISSLVERGSLVESSSLGKARHTRESGYPVRRALSI
jgi:hypothetical protein